MHHVKKHHVSHYNYTNMSLNDTHNFIKQNKPLKNIKLIYGIPVAISSVNTAIEKEFITLGAHYVSTINVTNNRVTR